MPEPEEVPQRDLTIHLLKSDVREPRDAIRNADRLLPITVTSGGNTVGELFVQHPRSGPPRWAEFFRGHLDITQLGRVASTAAVMVVKTSNRFFALTFGQGRYLLAPDCWEARFGLRVALNCINADRLRSLDKRTFDALSTHTRTQGSREGSATDFGLDIEQDLVRAVTGMPTAPELGKKLSGMDALQCTVRTEVPELKALLREYYRKYGEDTYKENFGWIDQIAEIKDKTVVEKLNVKLVESINGDRERCWLCVPEIIDWGRTAGFKYSSRRQAAEHHDLAIADFLESVPGEVVDVDLLRRRHVTQIDNEGTILARWSIYRCTYCEVELDDKTYILSTGLWYRVDRHFVEGVNDSFQRCLDWKGCRRMSMLRRELTVREWRRRPPIRMPLWTKS